MSLAVTSELYRALLKELTHYCITHKFLILATTRAFYTEIILFLLYMNLRLYFKCTPLQPRPLDRKQFHWNLCLYILICKQNTLPYNVTWTPSALSKTAIMNTFGQLHVLLCDVFLVLAQDVHIIIFPIHLQLRTCTSLTCAQIL